MAHPSHQNISGTVLAPVTGNSTFNGTLPWKQYVFTPAGRELKLTISVLIAVSSFIGFVGNLCVLRFTNNEQKKPVQTMSSHLGFFIRSLAVSDLLGSSIGASLVLIEINFDIFQSNMWSCIVSRFFQKVFIMISIYNLVVIGVERYICTCRPISRPLSLSTVKTAVIVAWVLGFLVISVCSYPLRPIRVELNSTHYTVVCKHNNYPSTRVIRQVCGLSAYVLPSVILIFTCVSIMRVLWKSKPNSEENSHQNGSEAFERWRTKRNKATTQLVVMMIAFIVPYLSFLSYATFSSVSTSSVDFETDYTVRAVSALLAYLNATVNFAIHLVQLSGFRQAMNPFQNIGMCRIGQPRAVAPV